MSFTATSRQRPLEVPKPERRRARRFTDGGASPALQVRKIGNHARNKPESDPDPLVATARLLAAEEEVRHYDHARC